MDQSAGVSLDLRLRLLDWWELRTSSRRICVGGREQRLITLLALRGCRPRVYIAGTLWPDATDARALASLRSALSQTRRLAPGLLTTPTRTTIGLDAGVRVDVRDVLNATHRAAEGGVEDPDRMVRELRSGELLPGWYDDWLLLERERLEQARLLALESVARQALACGRAEAAERAARLAIAIEPLKETAHWLLINALIADGQTATAVREFRLYSSRLQRELRICPPAPLAELVRSAAPSVRTTD